MIKNDTVIATCQSFVVADRIDKEQWVMGLGEPTILYDVKDYCDTGVLIETGYQSIITSPLQKFIVSDRHYKHATDLTTDDEVLTTSGFQKLTAVKYLNELLQMTKLTTKSHAFLGNGFYLIG